MKAFTILICALFLSLIFQGCPNSNYSQKTILLVTSDTSIINMLDTTEHYSNFDMDIQELKSRIKLSEFQIMNLTVTDAINNEKRYVKGLKQSPVESPNIKSSMYDTVPQLDSLNLFKHKQ